MALPTDDELHQLIAQVMRRTLAGEPSRPPITSGEPSPAPKTSQLSSGQKVAVGADHGGFPLKEKLKTYLSEKGYAVIDCGTNSADPVDYPDIALVVARLVSGGQAWRGIIVDGAGIGSCIVANKIPGVRAALCYDHATAVNSREHNDANVLTLGAGLIGENLARQIVTTWLSTEFGGGRHARRVEKMIAVEKQFLKSEDRYVS
jgi:ribose 5-phosphate isomerase B